MSHTSTIKTVTIVDVHALRAACEELRTTHGVNLTLEENAKPRGYYGSQEGMEQAAPFCIRLHDSQYDVGLYRNEEDTGYEARCDLWDGDIARQLGITSGECTREEASLGKLYNLYGVHASMRAAAAEGYDVTRMNQEDGSVKLVVNLAA